jgi:low affinity Fe/Cu permease
MTVDRIIVLTTSSLGSRIGLIVVPLMCGAGAWVLTQTALGVALAIVGISITQLILAAGDRDTKAIQAKLDEMIRVTAKADDRLIGIEREDGS